jgi:hypothetical protein
MKTHTVTESFIQEAHKAACDTWKKKLEKQFPDAFPKDITYKVKTWEDLLKIAGKDSNQVLPYRNARSKNEISQNALAKVQLISEVLNQGWTPDWNNHNEYKYYPYFEKTKSGWVVCSYVNGLRIAYYAAGMYFKSSELALFAGNTFLDIYKELLPE